MLRAGAEQGGGDTAKDTELRSPFGGSPRVIEPQHFHAVKNPESNRLDVIRYNFS